MKKTSRLLAVSILNRVDKGAFAEPLLDETLSGGLLPDKPDRALLTHLVYGVLRRQAFLDWVIKAIYHGKAKDISPPVRNILRVGLFQVFFTDRIPSFALVNEAVKTAKWLVPNRQGLVNALLRNAIRQRDRLVFPSESEDPIGYISVVHSHPPWLVERFREIFGLAEASAICRANNEIPPLTVRVNRLKTSREQLIAELLAPGIGATPTILSPDGLHLTNPPGPLSEMSCYKAGQFYIQDEASQLISRLVSPRPGETLLDLCAGSGGKTTHLAELMDNQGSIFALDIRQEKIEALHDATQKRGIRIIKGIVADGRETLPGEMPRLFDRILLDAPCSGLGTLRRNPEIKWRLKREDLPALAANQLALLMNAARYLKIGGYLVYATCSVLPEENEDVIGNFLGQRKDFQLGHPGTSVPARLLDESGLFRTSTHVDQTDGFFGAVLRKKA
ncbi:MAG: 16S rRNA (cytosine(967)-C(5))-methyltransferase RsmB [Smithellaceae bacterium]|nr:16S rRNA (cytosine(967)-C(5))-methyltransferase RsmB [Smithellaceae bacterium]